MATSDITPIQLPLAIDGATVEIPLTQGFVTTVDAIDGDLTLLKWFAKTERVGLTYARRETSVVDGKRSSIWMHRLIMERVLGETIPVALMVDHIDTDGLNNTRTNLRLATPAQNQRNRGLGANNKSGVNGVSWNAKSRRWQVFIHVDNKSVYLGLFRDFHEAAAARRAAEVKYWGEFAPLTNRA